MEIDIKAWWNAYAEYYQNTNNIASDSVHYGPFSPSEDELNLLGDVKNKRIVELGCGGAQSSIALARKGAKCTAIDFSDKQLRIAREKAREYNVGIDFIMADIQDTTEAVKGKFDIALSSFAFQFVSDLDKAFKSVNKLLDDEGVFVFSLDHPFYMITSKGAKVVRSYHDNIPITLSLSQVFDGREEMKGKDEELSVYIRRVSDILTHLKNAGFLLEEIVEPYKYSKDDPWREMYDKEITDLIAPTIIYSAKKRINI